MITIILIYVYDGLCIRERFSERYLIFSPTTPLRPHLIIPATTDNDFIGPMSQQPKIFICKQKSQQHTIL